MASLASDGSLPAVNNPLTTVDHAKREDRRRKWSTRRTHAASASTRHDGEAPSGGINGRRS